MDTKKSNMEIIIFKNEKSKTNSKTRYKRS